MRAIALILSLFTLLSAHDESAVLMLQVWIGAVNQHKAGEPGPSVDVLTAWTYNDLEAMRPYVEFLVDAPLEGHPERSARRNWLTDKDRAAIAELRRGLLLRGDFDTFRKRAAILHTDTAMAGVVPLVVEPPRPAPKRSAGENQRRVDVMSTDGRVERYMLANPHWDYATDILDSLPVKPTRDPFVALWSRTIGAYFASEHQYADALRHFAWARRAAPDDPLVLFGDASLQETLGAPRIQEYVRVTTLPNGLLIRGIDSTQTHLRRAEALLRKALGARPRFAEANLRLGRVLTQLQRHQEALPYLRTALAESRDPALNYYAHIFSGDAELSLSSLVEAEQSYRAALSLFRDGQAAQIGLASVISARGDRETALAAILPTLTKPPDSRAGDDPWWDYYSGDAANLEALLDEMRAPFIGGRQ